MLLPWRRVRPGEVRRMCEMILNSVIKVFFITSQDVVTCEVKLIIYLQGYRTYISPYQGEVSSFSSFKHRALG